MVSVVSSYPVYGGGGNRLAGQVCDVRRCGQIYTGSCQAAVFRSKLTPPFLVAAVASRRPSAVSPCAPLRLAFTGPRLGGSKNEHCCRLLNRVLMT